MTGYEPRRVGATELDRRLGYHPANDQTVPRYERNRAAAMKLAKRWDEELPPGREASLALTAVQEALMWANAAVACAPWGTELPPLPPTPVREEGEPISAEQLLALARVLGLEGEDVAGIRADPSGVTVELWGPLEGRQRVLRQVRHQVGRP